MKDRKNGATRLPDAVRPPDGVCPPDAGRLPDAARLPGPGAAALSAIAACAMAACLGAYFSEPQSGATGGAAGFFACWLLLLAGLSLRPRGREAAACGLLGGLFALMRVLGYSYETLDSYGLILKNGGTLVTALSALLSLWLSAACALALAFSLLRAARARLSGAPEPDEREMQRLFLALAAMLFLGSVPYLIVYAPGLNIFDTHDQILQFFGYPSYIGDGSALSDHHPVLLTLVYGGFMKLGLALGDANLGQLVYSLLSMAAVSLASALALAELRRWGLRGGAVLGIGAALALYPVPALYAFNMCKDVSAAPFVLLLVFLTLRLERTRGAALRGARFSAAFLAALLGLMLTRKPSLYALLFALPFWLLRYPGARRRLAALTLGAALLFQVGYTNLLLPALGVLPGETREMLSIPFQQTARYLKTYPEDVTPEERERLSRVLDVEHAAADYDPRLADPVKDATAPDLDGADLAAYARAWLSMGLRHPGVYADAWLNMIYGYFYPSESNTIVCLTLNSPDAAGVTLRQDPALDGLRLRIHDAFYYALRRLPGFGALFYADFPAWVLLLLLAALMVFAEPGAALAHMFFAGTLCICLLSPKSGEIRYMLPVLYALAPLLGEVLCARGREGGA